MSTQNYTDEIAENHSRAQAEVAELAEFQTWIDGGWEAAANGDTFETFDPVVDEPILSVPRCTATDVEAAVDRASEAFEEEWEGTDAETRSRRLFEWAEEIRNHREELALIESVDGGKPINHAKAEVGYAHNLGGWN